jgi:tetratricopeptide (TPR) repeat protein
MRAVTTTNHPKAPQQGVVMNRRLFLCPMFFLLLTLCASGQESPTDISARTKALQKINQLETAAREGESAHVSDVALANVYSELASSYLSAARYDQSEGALKRAISLFRRSPESRSQLADDLDNFGMLHVQMDKMREAHEEELEALQLRQNLGDSLGIARSWNSLAGFYFMDRKYAASRDFARRAVDEFSVNERANLFERVSSRFNLALALCAMKDCPSAIPVVKDGIDIAEAGFKPNDFPIGLGDFFLGYAYWKSGSPSEAGRYMEEGIAIMKRQLSTGHPIYLNALRQYALYLHKSHRAEDANAVEREIRLAENVIDVHSIPMQRDGLGLAGLR